MIRKTIALALPLALLAGCSGSTSDQPEANAADEGMIVPNALDTPFVNAEPSPEPSASPTPEAKAEPLPADEQVQEDADATGMTARVSREEAQPAEEKAAPAESVSEEKN